ncbi:PPE family protein, partial [Mycobacterium decipiens]|uniref:PPE family protein n=1 Tax=Mycobacterium decipiens TaxID=1430326 RepID=UPI0010556B83
MTLPFLLSVFTAVPMLWMGQPPEVHSTALSFGPGPGPLLDAGGAWQQLGLEYDWAAQELGNELAVVPWEGPSSQSYRGAHGRYLEWLEEAGQESQQQAVAHQQAAAAYSVALAEMPTLAELSVNRAANVALLSTNFFGINTIPLTINEADYARMWIQAAMSMQLYQQHANMAVVLNAPRNRPAPLMLRGPEQYENEAAGPIIEEPDDDPVDDNGNQNALVERPEYNDGPLIEEVFDDDVDVGGDRALVVVENADVVEAEPATIPQLMIAALSQLANFVGQTFSLIGNIITFVDRALGWALRIFYAVAVYNAVGMIASAIASIYNLVTTIIQWVYAVYNAVVYSLTMVMHAISFIGSLVTQFVATLTQLTAEYVPMLLGGVLTGVPPSVVPPSSAGFVPPDGSSLAVGPPPAPPGAALAPPPSSIGTYSAVS